MEFLWAFDQLDLHAIADIGLVALLFFGISWLLRGTQALALLRGLILVLVALILLSTLLQLQALGWVLQNVLTVLAVAIPVIFQPELRQMLTQLGRGGMLLKRPAPQSARMLVINEICQATEKLAERRHGALIVLQRTNGLQEYVRTGIALDGTVSGALLLTIFWPKTELHDGAAIIDQAGRIASAASVLPLSASRNMPARKMGTRHRAALGISEVTDAVCVIVSEETGKIAITHDGRMISKLDSERLRVLLNALYGDDHITLLDAPWRRLLSWGQARRAKPAPPADDYDWSQS
ncbi:MAG: TIGR00159 family protein [Armatimonadetes bacterium]|nr:TIGR00159 family protein [Anaerolineae bacterium]